MVRSKIGWRKLYPIFKGLEGRDISSLWSWYSGTGDFPVFYQLKQVKYNRVIIRCEQGGRVWDLKLKPSQFLERLDWDIARFELRAE